MKWFLVTRMEEVNQPNDFIFMLLLLFSELDSACRFCFVTFFLLSVISLLDSSNETLFL
jgi:hypothetical protein